MVKIINQTNYKSIVVISEKGSYTLKKGESCCIECGDMNPQVQIIPLEQSKVFIYWLFVLIGGFVDGDCVGNKLFCSVNLVPTDDDVIIIHNKEISSKKGFVYHSFQIESQNGKSEICSYTLRDVEKVKRKTKAIYNFVVSEVILLIISFVLFITSFDLIMLAVFGLVFFAFSLPSWKKSKKIDEFYTDEYVNKLFADDNI